MKPRALFRIFVYIFAAIGLILVLAYAAVESGITNTSGMVDRQHDYFKNQTGPQWSKDIQWSILKEAIKKDSAAINKASLITGVPARMIVAPLVVEQLRLFHSDRELFKNIFAPLKILGNQSQFSWGVMGIKQETARLIENNLKDQSSPWYAGAPMEHLLDFGSTTPLSDIDKERFLRLTDENDRYFSYLYGALFIKELEQQWEHAGFPISDKPEIIATLYNIGFDNSKPHDSPLSGGAAIEIGGKIYSFGGLAKSFYESEELLDEFPR